MRQFGNDHSVEPGRWSSSPRHPRQWQPDTEVPDGRPRSRCGLARRTSTPRGTDRAPRVTPCGTAQVPPGARPRPETAPEYPGRGYSRRSSYRHARAQNTAAWRTGACALASRRAVNVSVGAAATALLASVGRPVRQIAVDAEDASTLGADSQDSTSPRAEPRRGGRPRRDRQAVPVDAGTWPARIQPARSTRGSRRRTRLLGSAPERRIGPGCPASSSGLATTARPAHAKRHYARWVLWICTPRRT